MATLVAAWPTVALGQVVVPVERPEAPIPGKTYRQVGVKLWGQGAYERESIDGSQTQYKTLSRVEAGDIIVNKIWARNGSVSVISDDLAGCFVSGEFPTFQPQPDRLDPRWFKWLTKTRPFWEQCDEKSRGTSGKNRIRPEKFLEIEMPLPPLVEQRRIVGRIEELAERIEQARGLRREAMAEGDDLFRSVLFYDDTAATPTPMHDLVTLRAPDVAVEPDQLYHFAGVFSFGRGVFKGQPKYGHEFAYSRLTTLRAADFVYPKLMAWEGALGVVPPECDGLVVSPEFPVFEVHTDKVLPEVLDVYFRTPTVWPSLSGASTGTNVRRRRIQPSEFLRLGFPLPPMPVQRRLREVKSRFAVVAALQEQVSNELDALLPSVLDRAFRGEL